MFDVVRRVWLGANGSVFPDYGYASLVKFKPNNIIEATFRADYSEYDALVEGFNFEVKTNYELFVWCILKGDELYYNGLNFTTKPQVNNPQVQAVCAPSGREGFFLSVVEEITGDNQIAIKSDRKCFVSPNIARYPIRVRLPIIFPRTVLINRNAFLDRVKVYLIGSKGTELFSAEIDAELLPTPNIEEELSKNTRTLQFRYEAENVTLNAILGLSLP